MGYEYVNIDDCWSLKERNATGYIVADLQKFPQGIDGLANQVNALKLKLGIYSDAGTKTCAGYPGSLGHEKEDAKLWASWGIDCKDLDQNSPLTRETSSTTTAMSPPNGWTSEPTARRANSARNSHVLRSRCSISTDAH